MAPMQCLFVVDGTAGLGDDDEGMATVVKKSGIPVVVAANKIDNPQPGDDRFRLLDLGAGRTPSGQRHPRYGEWEIYWIGSCRSLPRNRGRSRLTSTPRIAIVGRPNTGKSTLLNRLCGSRRVIVSNVPGTTRDPVDVDVELDGTTYRLVDTAGIRRRPKITEDADYYAVLEGT